MPIVSSREGEREGILRAAEFMLMSARTAPKTGGIDDIFTALVYGDEKEQIAREMEAVGGEREISGFQRDAGNVRSSEAVLLIGVRSNKKYGLNCGACGYATCEEFEKAGTRMGRDFAGPACVFKALDLGIALGSAAKTASVLNVDNRIIYRVGVAAMRLKLLPEATIIMGIPLSAKGKSVYFDRR